MTEANKNAQLVETPKNTAMAVPDFVEQVAVKEGMEHVTNADMQMPRLAIAQQMSPELVEGDPKFIPGLKIGDLFNSLTQQIYGTGPLDFCVLRADVPRYIQFSADGKSIIDMNVPANDPRTLFGPMGEKPLATKFYDFIVMLLPAKEPIVISFKSTGIKAAKQLNGLIQMAGNVKMFAPKFTVSTVMVTNPKGRFGSYVIRRSGFLPDKETYDLAQTMFDGLKNKVIDIDRTGDHIDPDGGGDAHESGAGGSTDFDPSQLEKGGM